MSASGHRLLHNIACAVRRRRGRSASRRRRRGEAYAKNLRLALCEAAETQRALFSCPICRQVLTTPVTRNCGHTLCAQCIPPANRCVAGCGGATRPRACNVLVQDICSKWKEVHPKTMGCQRTSADILGFEPRYRLRSRHAGLVTLSEAKDSIVTRTLDLLLTKRVSEGHTAQISMRDVTRILRYIDFVKERYLRESWKHLDVSDLDCILCSRMFHEPVTTPCGHTFCRGCLARVIDHGLGCPLCMSALHPFDECNGVTQCIDDAIRFLFPRSHADRLRSATREFRAKNAALPVFVCTNAFPGVACPLYVYEPRYRLLARRCLQSRARRFAMVARLDNSATEEKFAPFGTILEVRDAVHLHNGTSILTTVGVRRFRVVARGEQDGYDTATVQYIKDSAVRADRLQDVLALHEKVYAKAARWVQSLTPRVLAEVQNCIGEMPPLEDHWYTLPDGPAWAWWLMPILPLSSKLQIGFLCTTDLEKRLRAIDKLLEHMKYKMKALKRSTLKCQDTVESPDSCRMSWLI